jgi:hypothetical protein
MSHSSVRFALACLLAIVPWAFQASGFAVSPVLATVLWLVAAGILIDLAWRSPLSVRWPVAPKAVLSVVFVAIAGFLSWKAFQGQPVTNAAAPASLPASAPAPLPPREFVETTPKEIADLYLSNTWLQVEKLTATYPGKWMRVSAVVGNIGSTGESVVVVASIPQSKTMLRLSFPKAAEAVLSVKRTGDSIFANCRINKIESIVLDFGGCELVKP